MIAFHKRRRELRFLFPHAGAERERHQERAAVLKCGLAEAGLPVTQSASHIVPVLIGEAMQIVDAEIQVRT